MENQHRKISGYRELDAEEIALMNRIKSFGPDLQILCSDLRRYLNGRNEVALAFNAEEAARINLAEPHAWLDKGTKELQTGLMSLTRCVAQPSFF